VENQEPKGFFVGCWRMEDGKHDALRSHDAFFLLFPLCFPELTGYLPSVGGRGGLSVSGFLLSFGVILKGVDMSVFSGESNREQFEKLAYDPETGIFTWAVSPKRSTIKAGSVAGSMNSEGYLHIGYGGRKYFSHRLAWLITYGDWPSGQVDHINGCRTDNRLENLRDVTHSVNQQNQKKARKNNKSGFLGVCWHKKSSVWVAQITVGRKIKRIGSFGTAEEAHKAYLLAKRECHAGCTI
jgi:hypothetical protein